MTERSSAGREASKIHLSEHGVVTDIQKQQIQDKIPNITEIKLFVIIVLRLQLEVKYMI